MAIQNRPYIRTEESGEQYWCRCGKTANEPYCDGSHERLNTGKMPLRVKIEDAKKVAWCGCRETKNPPYCDGSHSRR
jgi:CDGSH iron-sulfur domain-containing protein 3